jgi:3-keto-disaccharide hydrolase
MQARPQATESALVTAGTGWIDLQPTKDLKGWTRLPIPPTNSLGQAQWHVDRPGLLVCDGDGGHDMLRFNQELTNGIFHVEFRFVPVTGTNRNYNSGVFIRNSADGTIWHQAQLTMKGGYLFGNSPTNGVVGRFKTSPTELHMRPAGEWNTIEVTAKGKKLSVWLNGAETCVWDQCEVPKGFIGLEAEGYRVFFRDLKYKRLD